MSEQTNILEESYDRLQEAFESVSEEIESFQKRVTKQRKSFEKDARKRVSKFQKELRRSDLVKRTEKFQQDLERDIRGSDLVKRVRKLRKEATVRLESRIDDVLGAFQIATSADVKKLDRKLSQISKKLKEIEKARVSQPAAPSSTTLQ